MQERDPWWRDLLVLGGAGFFLWFGLVIMICDTTTRQVDWLGVGGRTGWRLSCALEMAGVALAVVLLLFALARLTNVVFDRRIEKRVTAGLYTFAVTVPFFLVPAGSCIMRSAPAPDFFDGPFGRELSCMVMPGLLAGALAIVFAIMYWWEYRK